MEEKASYCFISSSNIDKLIISLFLSFLSQREKLQCSSCVRHSLFGHGIGGKKVHTYINIRVNCLGDITFIFGLFLAEKLARA